MTNEPTTLEAHQIQPVNEIADTAKYESIRDSMEIDGWIGRPVLVAEKDGLCQALTGSHRISAARDAYIEIPVIWCDVDWDDPDTQNLEDDDWPAYLRETGQEDALKLMEEEVRLNDVA